MRSPKVLLLRAPGTNCDSETAFAFTQAGATVNPVHVRALCEAPDLLQQHAILALPGGFSYGDDLGSGTVLANELVQMLSEPLQRFVESGGLVLGICNGFQVLVKTGLLPGRSFVPTSERKLPGATLTFNDSNRFEDRWVHLKIENSESPFLKSEAGRVVTFPVAHGEGKFMARDETALQKLEDDKQIAFRYSALNGDNPKYPENPNGARHNIAGITDETGRVLGLMPHPERYVLPWQHPRWTREGLKTEGDGMFLFRNAVKHAQKN